MIKLVLYKAEIEKYLSERHTSTDETRKTRKALVDITAILQANGHTWLEDSDIEAYSKQSTNSVAVTKRNTSRIKTFFEWLRREIDSMDDVKETKIQGTEPEILKDTSPTKDSETWLESKTETIKHKSKPGRKRFDTENGEKRSEKFMLYLTPELISEVRTWCHIKQISAVSYITGLIEADLHSEDKQGKLASFRKFSAEA